MPELPDLAILADALDTALSGRASNGAVFPQSLVLRGTSAEAEALRGQQLRQVTRRGKFLVFDFERDRVVFNAMLTGRLGLATRASKKWPQLAARFDFGPAMVDVASIAGRKAPVSAWPGHAAWLPARDVDVELRYRDATRMGKIYLLPAGVKRPVAGWDEQALDADDPELSLDVWRTRIGRHSGELKNLLRNQEFIAGVGNAYSDEILWDARLLPFRKRSSLAPDEVDALYTSLRGVLEWAIAELRKRVPPRLEVEQRDFLRVHRKGGEPCPRCGTRLSEVSAGGFATTFCRSCQR